MTETASVGVIGTGQIGSRMTRRLVQAGYRVVIHDRDAAAMEGISGAQPVASAAEVAHHCDLIITCVTDNACVRDAVLGSGGVIERVRPGHLVIETTTSTPATTRDVATALRGHGADLIDAPVSRGVPAAENGTLSIMVGGRDESLARAKPVLSVLGTDIIPTGEVGTGHVAKAMNMMVMGVNFVATLELMLLAESHGLTREAAIAGFAAGSGRSFVVDHHWPRYILPGTYDSGFTLGLMWKDLRVAREVVEESGQVALLGERVASMYRWAAKQGMSAQDNTRLVEFAHGLKAKTGVIGAQGVNVKRFAAQLDQTLFAALYLGTLEALAVGEAVGLERSRLLQVLDCSSGGSAVTANLHRNEVRLDALHEDAKIISCAAVRSGDLSFLTGAVTFLLDLARRELPSVVTDDAVIDFIGYRDSRSERARPYPRRPASEAS